ncbi:MAG: UvrB/UvrC motif-containing protein [Longimicrobiales bacterium]
MQARWTWRSGPRSSRPNDAATNLDFERAARLRDELLDVRAKLKGAA